MRFVSAFIIGCLSLVLVALGAAAGAATVTGTTLQPSIVWISDGSTVPESVTEVHNSDRQFVPSFVVIRAGTNVRFPNDDPFFHSIYSASSNDLFDIGYYGFGPGKVVKFPAAGIIEVRCHIHARMRGTIVVTDGPSSGGLGTHFKIDGVLSGLHNIYSWNARTGVKSSSVKVPVGDATDDLGTIP